MQYADLVEYQLFIQKAVNVTILNTIKNIENSKYDSTRIKEEKEKSEK